MEPWWVTLTFKLYSVEHYLSFLFCSEIKEGKSHILQGSIRQPLSHRESQEHKSSIPQSTPKLSQGIFTRNFPEFFCFLLYLLNCKFALQVSLSFSLQRSPFPRRIWPHLLWFQKASGHLLFPKILLFAFPTRHRSPGELRCPPGFFLWPSPVFYAMHWLLYRFI